MKAIGIAMLPLYRPLIMSAYLSTTTFPDGKRFSVAHSIQRR